MKNIAEIKLVWGFVALIIVSAFSSCVRHDTYCECINNQINNGATMYRFILPKNIKMADAEKECIKFHKNSAKYDTCRPIIIK